MGRNIIICCDGTGNRFGRKNTNIVKVCECLAHEPDQIVYYDPGVGTLGDQHAITSFKRGLTRALGGMIGFGLMGKVKDAYDFLAWHYQPDDHIFLFGFSRGAYTVRALAALLHMYGLTGPGAGNLTPYLTTMITDNSKDKVDPAQAVESKFNWSRWMIGNYFRKHFARRVEIEFVGVFDTVASAGWFWNPLRIPYTTHNPSVKRIRHAVSIDERRGFFLPNLYDYEPNDPESRKGLPGDFKEAWFPGVHSDVGGGYDRDKQGLAQVAFEWMLGECTGTPWGLRCDPKQIDRVLHEYYAKPDFTATRNESLTLWWRFLEFVPRVGGKRGTDGKWHRTISPNFFRPRTIKRGSMMHESVTQRWASRPDWRPKNLQDPAEYPQCRTREGVDDSVSKDHPMSLAGATTSEHAP